MLSRGEIQTPSNMRSAPCARVLAFGPIAVAAGLLLGSAFSRDGAASDRQDDSRRGAGSIGWSEEEREPESIPSIAFTAAPLESAPDDSDESNFEQRTVTPPRRAVVEFKAPRRPARRAESAEIERPTSGNEIRLVAHEEASPKRATAGKRAGRGASALARSQERAAKAPGVRQATAKPQNAKPKTPKVPRATKALFEQIAEESQVVPAVRTANGEQEPAGVLTDESPATPVATKHRLPQWRRSPTVRLAKAQREVEPAARQDEGPIDCSEGADFKKISELDCTVAMDEEDDPPACPLKAVDEEPREWQPTRLRWTASGMCYKPLYFEEPQVERYGHSFGVGPILQPFVSGAHFFAAVPLMPYKMGVDPPLECQYPLGYYRPGNCAPWVVPPFPLSWRGAGAQAAVVTGSIFAFP